MHAMIEPVVALLFIIAPFVLDFDDSTARTLSIVIGVVILVVGMTTRWRLSLVKLIPLQVHFAGDLLIGIVSIAAPFVLGFSDEPLVSSDYIGNPNSSTVDALSTYVIGGNLVKVVSWYDNEWGYSNRVADLAYYISGRGESSNGSAEETSAVGTATASGS